MVQLPLSYRWRSRKLGLADRADVRHLYAARAARGFGDGFAAIILPAYLLEIGFDPFQIGLVGHGCAVRLGRHHLGGRVSVRRTGCGTQARTEGAMNAQDQGEVLSSSTFRAWKTDCALIKELSLRNA
jgi:hypothetical protein